MPDIPKNIRAICVFCGSAAGNHPAYTAAAHDLVAWLARARIKLVYGGGGIGLMGSVARSAADNGGEVDGIIPEFLTIPEVMRDAPGAHQIIGDLHQRMQLMAARADAFVVLPGGIGTIAELVDSLTWKHLRQHTKPIVIWDVEGYWTPLAGLLDHIIAHGFAHGDLAHMFRIVKSLDALPAALDGQAR